MLKAKSGFTLLELMIVIAIVAILVTLAYPSYADFIRKARRADAHQALLDGANQQEIWRADNATYNAALKPANTTYYTFTITGTSATAFLLTATAQGGQALDKEGSVSCTTLTMTQVGTRGSDQRCWKASGT